MIDVAVDHPFTACVAFAVQWLEALSRYDLVAVEALIDVNESGGPVGSSLPVPEGFTYCTPENVKAWTVRFMVLRRGGYSVEFDVPFVERKWREMVATFHMKPVGSGLQVRFLGLKPS